MWKFSVASFCCMYLCLVYIEANLINTNNTIAPLNKELLFRSKTSAFFCKYLTISTVQRLKGTLRNKHVVHR